MLCGMVKLLRSEAVAKASLIRAKVAWCRPEAERSIHGQGEGGVIPTGGPNPPMLKNGGMSCGSE